jgi:hypothetical protein
MKRRLVVFLLVAQAVALAAVAGTQAADEPKSINWEETGPFRHVDGTGPHNTSQQLLLAQRASGIASSGVPVSQDVGNVAVVVDNGKIFVQPKPGNPFDLMTPTNIEWTRVDADTFSAAFAPASFDPTIGSALSLGDDDTTEVALPFSFPFLGASYNSVHVNSDGNVTFGVGDSASTPRDAARLIGGPPRIAPFLNDLNVEDGGSISASVRATEVVITWKDVPEFGIANQNTFQLTLDSSGNIVFAYQSLDAEFGVVGVAEGNDEGPINEIDLTAALPATKDAGAIFEEFFPPVLVKQMNVIEAAKEFYKTHPDKYDFLVMFEDSITDIGFGAFAFHLGVKNQTSGFGRPVFDSSASAGSAGELESILQMNRIGLYWPDADKLENPPIKKFRFGSATLDGPPGADQISRRARWMGTLNGDFGAFGSYTLGLNSAMSIMGQEAGHRWLAFTRFQHPTDPDPFDTFDLLGRANAHWSFFFNVAVPPSQFGGDPRASSAEGNAIVDLGAAAGPCAAAGQTRFLTERNELIDGYTKLDQYLMGLLPGKKVGPFWYVDNPTRVATGESRENIRAVAAQDDILFCGNRVNLTVANIQAIHGPRIPAIGDETDTDANGNPKTDVKTMAFILVVDKDSPKADAHASAISQVDTFRRTWQTYGNGKATGGLGRFDTSLSPATH